jgi:serine/threonine protein kinase
MDLNAVPEPMNSRIREHGWVPLEQIGEGGGARVFLCAQAELVHAFNHLLADASAPIRDSTKDLKFCTRLVRMLALSLVSKGNALAALKIPKDHDDSKTCERLKREIVAMREVPHPSLIRLIDFDQEDSPGWFVMEYHQRGTLADSTKQYHGRIVKVLEAIRPIAEGVAALNEKGYVHRDIKPNNIFLAQDGKLVLGDFGIVFPRPVGEERFTELGTTLISRDWAPDWIRFSDSQPEFKVDVFMLAKVIYFMATGGGKVLATQLDEPQFDLSHILKMEEGASELQKLLMECITSKEKECKFDNAGDLLVRLDELLCQLTGRSQTHLVFSFLSVHSTTDIPVLAYDDPAPRYPSLKGLQVLFPNKCKVLRARARVMGGGSGRKLSLSFKINGRPITGCEMTVDLTPGIARWTDEMTVTVSVPFQRGWQSLDIIPLAESQGMQLTGFMLYGN